MLKKSFAAALLVAGLAGFSLAQEKAQPAKEQKFEDKVADAKPCCARACGVNFTKELNVPFDYLGTIGARIATARKTPDPVDLAMAGQSLAVAEAVSGKKASVTSTEVIKEAIDLAKLRGYSAELTAVALIVTDDAAKKDLAKAAAVAKKLEDEAKAQPAGSGDKDLVGNLIVFNRSGECVKIYVDGKFVGEVHAGDTTAVRVHSHSENTLIQAICEDGDVVSQRIFAGRNRGDFHWHLK